MVSSTLHLLARARSVTCLADVVWQGGARGVRERHCAPSYRRVRDDNHPQPQTALCVWWPGRD
eukprot:1045105-Rhodomonas_salina.1